jgi:O-antigen ligase
MLVALHEEQGVRIGGLWAFGFVLVVIAFFRLPSHEWFGAIFTFGEHKILTAELIAVWAFLLLTLSLGRIEPAVNVVGEYLWLLLAYLVPVLIAGVGARDLGLGLHGVSVAVASCMAVVVVYQAHRSDRALVASLRLLTVGGVAIGMYLMYTRAAPDTSLRTVTLQGQTFYQLTIPGIDKNTTGMLVGILSLVALWFAAIRNGYRRVVWAGVSLFLVLGMALTFSRGAALSWLAGLLYLVVRRRVRIRWFLTWLGAIGAALVVSGIGVFLLRVATALRYLSSDGLALIARYGALETSDRLESVGSTFRYFLQSPVVGVGPMNLEMLQNPHAGLATSEHNAYLKALAETGMLGIAGLMVFFVLCARAVRRAMVPSRIAGHPQGEWHRELGDLLAAVLLMYLVNFVVAPIDYSFWVWCGLILAWSRNQRYAKHSLIPAS